MAQKDASGMFNSGNDNQGSHRQSKKVSASSRSVSSEQIFDAASINKSIKSVKSEMTGLFSTMSKMIASTRKEMNGLARDLSSITPSVKLVAKAYDGTSSSIKKARKENESYRDSVRSMMDDAKRMAETEIKHNEQRKKYPMFLRGQYDKLIRQQSELNERKEEALKLEKDLQKQLNKAVKSGNTEEAKGIRDKIKSIEVDINADGVNLDKFQSGIDKVAAAFTQALSDSIHIFTGRLRDGVNKYFDAYEASFTDLATRMSMDYKTTRDFYSDGISKVYDENMSKVINIADDLVPAMQAVSKQGLTGDTAMSKAYGDSIAKVLTPWLDTNTEAFVNLSANLSEQQIKTLKGQQLLLQETQSGNRLLQSGVINSLTSDMTPLLTSIDLNTGGKNNLTGEYQAMMEEMVARGATENEAYGAVRKLVEIEKDPYKALTSGDASAAMYAVNRQNGMSAVNAYNQTYGKFNSMAVDKGGFARGAIMSSMRSDLGFSEVEAYKIATLDGKVSSRANQIGSSNNALSAFNESLDNATDKLTRTKRFTNSLENASSSTVGKWITAIPAGKEWFNIVVNLLKGILAAVGSQVAGNLFGNFKGKFGSNFSSKLESTVSNKLASELGSTVKDKISDKASSKLGGKVLSKIGSLSTVGVLANLAIAAGGIASSVDGVKNVKNKNAGTGSQVASGAQAITGAIAGGAGLAGAGLLLASNPVGWTVAIVGAAALAISGACKVAAKALDKTSAATREVTSAYEAQVDQIKENYKADKEKLKENKKQIDELSGIEEKKKFAIENGLISPEDASRMTEKSFDKLFKEYEKSEKKYLKDKKKAQEEQLKEMQKVQEKEAQEVYEKNKKTLTNQITQLEESGSTDKVVDILKAAGASDKDIEKYKKGKKSANDILNKKRGFLGTKDSLIQSMTSDDWKSLTSNEGLDQSKFQLAKMSAEEKAQHDAKLAELRAAVTSAEKNYGKDHQRYKSAVSDLEIYEKKAVSMYAAGLPYAYSDATVRIHEGEGILTKAQNAAYRASAQTLPVISKMFGGLFDNPLNKLSNKDDENESSSKDNEKLIDVVKEVGAEIVKAIRANNSRDNKVDENNRMLPKPTVKADQNAINLTSIFA